MKINRVICAYFSPGGTTKKVVKTIASVFSDYPVYNINLADYDARQAHYDFKENDLLILGAPAYAGRLPAPVVAAIEQFHCVNTPVAMVVTYGNRAVDDTLMEMSKTLTGQGFIPCAAATFSCQHTFLSDVALGRPDESDLAIARKMGEELKERLRLAVSYAFQLEQIPGSYPYVKPPMGQFPFVVETSEFCFYCMLCAGVCPMQAISSSNPFEIDNEKCVRCKSCITICPAQAKSFTEEPFKALQKKLEGFIDVRQEPWYIIG